MAPALSLESELPDPEDVAAAPRQRERIAALYRRVTTTQRPHIASARHGAF